MSDRLAPIVERRRAAVAAARAARPTEALWDALAKRASGGEARRDFRASLAGPGLSVIAELKRRSPSAGALRPAADAAETARTYADAGAAALSILTEPDFFGGSLDDLHAARACQDRPLLRKDFVVDEHQIAESRLEGADAVLLIVSVLGRATARMIEACGRAGLDALVEVHDADELALAADCGARIVGVNNRNLTDMSVDLGVAERLLPRVPRGTLGVAESGIETADDAGRMRAAGAEAILVGGALMRAGDPGAALRALSGAEGDDDPG